MPRVACLLASLFVLAGCAHDVSRNPNWNVETFKQPSEHGQGSAPCPPLNLLIGRGCARNG